MSVRLYIWRLTLLGAGKRQGACYAYVAGRVYLCIAKQTKGGASVFKRVAAFSDRIKYYKYNFF